MANLPRVALGSVQEHVDAAPMLWALCDVVRRHDLQAQVFHSEAHFHDAVAGDVICGASARYLDSWLMPPDLCRESFAHGARGADLSIVAGRFRSTGVTSGLLGGSLAELCDWLDLAEIVVMDVSEWDGCRLPDLPAGTAGILIDGVSPEEFPKWMTTLESLYGAPVLGSLPRLPEIRKRFRAAAQGATLGDCVCGELGDLLAETLRLDVLLQLARREPLSLPAAWLFRPGEKLAGLKIAVAYDQAFGHYFPEVLDLLEMQGAEVCDFSPLHDEKLPDAADVVYIGDGRIAHHMEQLSANPCLAMALREHVRLGKRLYAEGSGVAYLCQHAWLDASRHFAMAGVLPAVALANRSASRPAPVEITLERRHWLGHEGTTLRGYRSSAWRIEPRSGLDTHLTRPVSVDMIGYAEAVGSRLSINFAAQPQFLKRFSTSPDAVSSSAVR
jgi:cobyrinic acid a,c-diamide synthase